MSNRDQTATAAPQQVDEQPPLLFAFLPAGGVDAIPGCGSGASNYIFCNKIRVNRHAVGQDQLIIMDQDQNRFVLNKKRGPSEGALGFTSYHYENFDDGYATATITVKGNTMAASYQVPAANDPRGGHYVVENYNKATGGHVLKRNDASKWGHD